MKFNRFLTKVGFALACVAIINAVSEADVQELNQQSAQTKDSSVSKIKVISLNGARFVGELKHPNELKSEKFEASIEKHKLLSSYGEKYKFLPSTYAAYISDDTVRLVAEQSSQKIGVLKWNCVLTEEGALEGELILFRDGHPPLRMEVSAKLVSKPEDFELKRLIPKDKVEAAESK